MRDPFRPCREPATTLYDAICADHSLANVWPTARDIAQQRGWRVLLLHEVKETEAVALGHVDYAAKWTYALLRRMEVPE